MKKLLSVLIVVMMAVGLMIPVFASAEDRWVNCANGKKLNLRAEPQAHAKLVGRIECGKKVEVLDANAAKGWARVRVEGTGATGYVSTKFLVSKKPGKYEITERDDSFRSVSPYMVEAKARGKNSEDSVCLRVKPNKTSSAIRRLMAGDQLQVIARGRTWSQVRDPMTGATGYVANDYMTRL